MQAASVSEATLPEVPTLPFSRWRGDPQGFADALGRALRETGFAVVEGHTIEQPVIDRVADRMERFFALPDATKTTYAQPEAGFQRGYSPFGTESAKGRSLADLKEFWHTGRDGVADIPPNPSVGEVEGFDATTQELFAQMDRFGQELLEAVALHLGEARDRFADFAGRGNSILRLLKYPALDNPPPEGSVRAAAHEDINLITLLLGAGEPGLEVLHRSGVWMPINAPRGSVVVNVGDMLQRLTAGILPSTTHRVVNPAPERSRHARYSMPFFLHPNNDAVLEALPGCVAEGGVAQVPITAGNYLEERLVEIGLRR